MHVHHRFSTSLFEQSTARASDRIHLHRAYKFTKWIRIFFKKYLAMKRFYQILKTLPLCMQSLWTDYHRIEASCISNHKSSPQCLIFNFKFLWSHDFMRLRSGKRLRAEPKTIFLYVLAQFFTKYICKQPTQNKLMCCIRRSPISMIRLDHSRWSNTVPFFYISR